MLAKCNDSLTYALGWRAWGLCAYTLYETGYGAIILRFTKLGMVLWAYALLWWIVLGPWVIDRPHQKSTTTTTHHTWHPSNGFLGL